VGSNTKTMTSTVILQLVEEGELSLDDPVSRYIDGVPNGDQITIANLSEMRSGLFSYTSDPGFNQTLDDRPEKAWTPQELLDIAFSHPVNAAPDTEFEYCNTNIVLLGLIIEELTGTTATQAFEERIFQPLGLTQSLLPMPDDASLADPHSTGYQFLTNVETIDSYAVPAAQLPAALDGSLEPLEYTDANPSWAWTAGAAISTADELATYVEAMVDGGLLDAQTQKVRMDSIREITTGAGYGLGIAQFGPMYGHDGQLPGFSTFMARDPKTGTTLIIGTNLSASPVNGENAAVVIAKAAMGVLYDGSVATGDRPDGVHRGLTDQNRAARAAPPGPHFMGLAPPWGKCERWPPSTTSVWPDMNDDSFEHRNTSGPAISSGVPQRPRGMPSAITMASRSSTPAASKPAATRGVAMQSGATPLARMP
jgi:D-alanyl-D-alanine carboxypeptidase